jgi:RimJ/RimL family protein N-acetyltransferase
MLIRPFTLADLTSFHRTLDAVARERRHLALLEAPPIGEAERYLRTALEQGAIHFVAEDDGRVVGWCDVTPRQQPGSSHIGHLGMGLLPEYRGQGIGYRILDTTVREGFGKGLTRIDLEVFSSNQAAIALYRRYGFIIEGCRRKARHVDGMWDDIVLMALEPGVVRAPNNPITNRIERQAATPGLAAILASLSAPDLQSLLLEVYRQQAASRTPAAILAEHSRNRFTRPSQGSARAFASLERLAHENLPSDFEALELSPVCPLATCSGVAAVGQDWSVATIRNTEVVSDPTNVLALECALRRKNSAAAVNLAATHRVLRPQKFSGARMVSHFRVFTLASAGRDEGNRGFEMRELSRHASFYVRLVRAFSDPRLPIRIALTDFGSPDRGVQLEEQMLGPLRVSLNVECCLDPERPSGRGYYRDLCMKIHAQTPEGEWIELGDGGSVDWTQRLLSNSKERLVTSGIGSERVCTLFALR